MNKEIKYNFGDRPFYYEITSEDQKEAIADYLYHTFFRKMEQSDTLMEALKKVAEEERYDMDYEDVYYDYFKEKAHEEWRNAE